MQTHVLAHRRIHVLTRRLMIRQLLVCSISRTSLCGFHSFNGQIDVFYSRAFVPDSFGKLEESSAKRAKLCPPARRPHFSGKQPVSHADLVSRPRGDSDSALGVPFGGVLVENRLGGEIFSNFPSLRSARLVLDFQPCSTRTGDGGRPETGSEPRDEGRSNTGDV